MEYEFRSITRRRGSGSYKWDAVPPFPVSGDGDDIIPMWVADMDFRVAPFIIEALRKRVDHGIFGYTSVPESFYRSTIGWFSKYHGWNIDREWMMYTSGVVPAISAVIKALTSPGDEVIVQTPVYNCFFSSIRNNGKTGNSPTQWTGRTLRRNVPAPRRRSFFFATLTTPPEEYGQGRNFPAWVKSHLEAALSSSPMKSTANL